MSSDEYEQNLQWVGEPVCTRAANKDDFAEERDDENEESESKLHYEFWFYNAFERVVSPNFNSSRRKARTRGDTDETEMYEVGDTVLINSSAKLPSIGVITSMWELKRKGHGGDDEREPEDLINVKVHWFLRPTELPRIRAHRVYYEVCDL